jgi:asparaginyl-tRNA synthetase
MHTKIRQILLAEDQESLVGQEHIVKGWVKTVRVQKNLIFIEVNDGSSFNNLQVIAESNLPNFAKDIVNLATGSSIVVTGVVAKSPGQNQPLELHANTIRVLGIANQETYPLQKKRHSFEFLRTVAHLRPRTNTFGAVARVRNALSYATHEFFQNRGFLYIQTPLITTADCEGAGELFKVTTLDLENPPKNASVKFYYGPCYSV